MTKAITEALENTRDWVTDYIDDLISGADVLPTPLREIISGIIYVILFLLIIFIALGSGIILSFALGYALIILGIDCRPFQEPLGFSQYGANGVCFLLIAFIASLVLFGIGRFFVGEKGQ